MALHLALALVQGAHPAALWEGHIKQPAGVAAYLTATRSHRASSAQKINEQWTSQGVFVHQFDALQDRARPWLINTMQYSFTSVSISSSRFPYVYSTSLGGMLWSNDFVLRESDSPVHCACACDCNSMNRGASGCANTTQLPGSQPADTGCDAEKSAFATAYRTIDDMLVRLDPKPNSRCVWTPTKPYSHSPADLDDRGRPRPPPGETRLGHFDCMYNEIVLSSHAVNGAMPSVLEGFFFTVNCWRDPRAHLLSLPTNATQVQAVYEQFLAAYPSAPAPLFLSFDCAKLARHEPPFEDASHLWITADA